MPTLAITIPFQGECELNNALALLTAVNVVQLRAHRKQRREKQWPALYASGVVYKREAAGLEEWQCAEEIYARKTADCEDLACLRAAECIVNGEKTARPHAYKTRAGWHIVVRRADGSLEDPSARLGMNRK